MFSNVHASSSVEAAENDLQTVERLTGVIERLASLGTAEQRRGRSRTGQFVAQPAALEAQPLLEQALLAAAKRIKQREGG